MLPAQKYIEIVERSLESGVPGNSHAPFGEGRLETQVVLGAGRLFHELGNRGLLPLEAYPG